MATINSTINSNEVVWRSSDLPSGLGWISGVASTGKTALAEMLRQDAQGRGRPVVVLDTNGSQPFSTVLIAQITQIAMPSALVIEASRGYPPDALPRVAWAVLLRQDAHSVARWASHFDLSANEQAWLTQAALGHGLLIVPDSIFGAQRWACWIDPTRGIITDGGGNAIGYRPKARQSFSRKSSSHQRR